ncbi:BTB/POZ domain-containing protein At2g04740-like [Lolium perenne]|uniref:BTB/POZ domain-containing protein At2g04740-like n=1 Tax=Lolium perenne TaxID=4522 RepID=UPI0021F5292A|nr:BTB/POZ domain-containing protein At2g04740-like [Lolium perenne]
MGFGSPAGMDLFQAARAGDCARLSHLIEGGADVNAYDRWDSTPLYYACFAGHYEAARMLLKAGAIYVESTLEGERCYRGALNLGIRGLLQDYEGRPPPSPPSSPPLTRLSAAFLSALLASPDNRVAAESTVAPDITLYVEGRPIEAHRVILAARSPYFRRKLATEWRNLKEVTLPSSHSLPFRVMCSLRAFFYSDWLEVFADDLEAVARACRAFEGEVLHEMANRLDARRWLYRGAGKRHSGPQRFFLQAQPEQHRLPSALRLILQDCLANSREEYLQNNSDYDDLADIRIRAGDRVFRCHHMVLALRSEYFRTRLPPRTDAIEHNNNLLEEHDVSPEAFEKMLEYAYTDEIQHLDDYPLARADELLDVASRYMLFPLKPILTALPLPSLDLDHVSPAQLCRWLMLSDLFDAPNVREHCLDVVAYNFEVFADAREFRALLRACRRGALFHDLRERCLGAGAAGLKAKDESVALFDERLEMLVLAAQQEANDDQARLSSVPPPRSRASLIRQIATRLMEVLFCCIMPAEQESSSKSNV